MLMAAIAVAEEVGAILDLSKLPKPPGQTHRGPEALRLAPKGTRNDTLNREAYRDAQLGQLTEAREEEYRQAAKDAGLDGPETDGTLRSAANAGRRLQDVSPAPPSIEPLKGAEIDWSTEPPPRRWLVDQAIPFGRVATIYGDGAIGKSRMLLQLALAVICDEDGPMLPRDREVGPDVEVPLVLEHGPVVIVTWEDEIDEFRRRMAFARNAGVVPAGVTAEVLHQRLQVINMRAIGGPLWAPRRNGSLHISTEGTWTEAGLRLLALMKQQRPALLTIDPLAAAYACSENSRALVRRFVCSLDAAAEACGVTTLICGHPPKDSDGNYLATCQAQEPVEDGLHLGAVGKFISITVLSRRIHTPVRVTGEMLYERCSPWGTPRPTAGRPWANRLSRRASGVRNRTTGRLCRTSGCGHTGGPPPPRILRSWRGSSRMRSGRQMPSVLTRVRQAARHGEAADGYHSRSHRDSEHGGPSVAGDRPCGGVRCGAAARPPDSGGVSAALSPWATCEYPRSDRTPRPRAPGHQPRRQGGAPQ